MSPPLGVNKVCEKFNNFRMDADGGRVMEKLGCRSRLRKLHVDRHTEFGGRTARHWNNLVGEQQRLVEIVGDHDCCDRLARFGAQLGHILLKRAACQRIERAEWLIQE